MINVAFWTIMTLIGILMVKNIWQLFANYGIEKKKEKFILAVLPIGLLGFLLIVLTTAVFNFFQEVQDPDLTDLTMCTNIVNHTAHLPGKLKHRLHPFHSHVYVP